MKNFNQNKKMVDFWEDVHKKKRVRYLSPNRPDFNIKILEIEQLLLKDITYLEVGIGQGSLLKEINKKTKNCYAVDISKTSLMLSKKYIKRGWLNTELFNLPHNFFDLITCLLVFQHIDDKELKNHLYHIIPSLKTDGIYACQFAFGLNDYEIFNNKYFCEEQLQKGLSFRTLDKMVNLIQIFNGKITIKGFHKFENIGWYILHISKK